MSADMICGMATIGPLLRQAQEFADMYNRNRAHYEQAARIANQMAPTIRLIQDMAPTIAIVQRVQRDMTMAAILARQHAQITALLPSISLPTETELVETEDRIAELVPEDEAEREQVADLASEIQADPEGKQLIGQVIGWVNEGVARMGDLAAKHVTEVGLLLLAFVVFMLPHEDYAAAGLYAALACAWLAYRQLKK